MPDRQEDHHAWMALVNRLGFRAAAVARLQEHLKREWRLDRVAGLVRRLGKYLPQAEILAALAQNPVWQAELAAAREEVPEVSAEPQVLFVFQGDGNVPQPPLVVRDRLYFGSGAVFYALEADTGGLVWQYRLPQRVWGPAWVADDFLYAAAGGELLALDLATGAVRWRFKVHKHLTAPFSCAGRVFVGSEEGTLYALDGGSGGRLWTFNVAAAVVVATAAWKARIFAASKDHSLYAVDTAEGDCVWRFTTGGPIYAAPFLSEGVLYLTSADHRLYALEADRGRRQWTFVAGGELRTPPAVAGGLVFVGCRDRHLYVLAAESGQLLWRRQFFGYPSAVAPWRGMVYLTAQGRVYGLTAADGRLCWCFPLGRALATTPVPAPQRIYVGTLGGRLLCLQYRTPQADQEAGQVLSRFLERAAESVL